MIRAATLAAGVILALWASSHTPALAQASPSVTNNMIIRLEPGEKIWSGVIKDGENLPYASGSRYDFYANNRENQIQPLLLGSRGLWVWSDEPYAFEIAADQIIITRAQGGVKYGRSGQSLAAARKFASDKFFPPSGRMPDELLFAKPQYNTWIELTYHQNQEDVLKYARAIVANGFSPGVLMIDDTWQENYGVWNFHPGRFPDPKLMMAELHRLGFKVMLWVCPFVSADQAGLVRELLKDKCFLMRKKKRTDDLGDGRRPGHHQVVERLFRVAGFQQPVGGSLVQW